MPSFGGIGKEAITFVLSGDASGLIKTFGDVEKAADKSLGKTEDKIEKLSATMTKVGAVSMATGLSTALGLVQFIKDAEDAEQATNKFETAVKGMHSSIDTGAIKKLAFDLQQVSTVTDEQVVAAARWGAVYGLTTDQLEQLLTAAVDLAAQTGKSLDVVTKSLAKAATGGATKPLEKLGLQFDDTAMKADAFAATMEASTAFAGGAAAKQVDTFSGQLQRLGNNWDNVKEQIGAGANEVFEPMARGAADLSEQLAKANPELLKSIGHFTALGSLGMTGFGGLATFAGQIANIREGLGGLGIKLKNSEGGLNNLGKAAAGAGLAMATLAVSDVVFGVINDATDNTQNFADALNDFTAKSKEAGHGSQMLARDFSQMAQEQDKQLKFSHIWEDWGARIVTTFDGVEVSIEDVQSAFDTLDPQAAKTALDTLQSVTNTLPKNSDQRKTNQEFIDKNRKSLDLEAKAADSAAKATGGLTKAEQDNADALKEWDKQLAPMGGKLFLLQGAADMAAAGAKGFSDAIEGMDSDERVKGATDLGDAFHKVGETIKDLPATFDETKAALGGYNEEQTKAITAVTDWGDATKAQIDTLIKSGASTDEVTLKSAAYITQLRNVMTQAGFTNEQIDAYLQTLGLTPGQVKTAIELSGDAEAKWKLQLYHSDLVTLTEDQQTWIRTLIDQGQYDAAWRSLNKFKEGAKFPVTPYLVPGVSTSNPFNLGSAPRSASTAVVPMGAVPTTQAALPPAQIHINVQTGIGDPAEIGRKVIDAIRSAERVQGSGWRR